MVCRSRKCECQGWKPRGLPGGPPPAPLRKRRYPDPDWAPGRDESGSSGPGKNGYSRKYLLRADSGSRTLTPGERWGQTVARPCPSFKYTLKIQTEFIQSLQKKVLHRALFAGEELKENTRPSPPRTTGHPGEAWGAEGAWGPKNDAGGGSIPFTFSSEPGGALTAGAGRWRGALAAGPRQSCSVSWAGARCKEGCCSS